MKKRAAILRGVAGITAFLFFLCTAATTLTFHYAGIINQALGISTTQIVHSDDAAAADAVVYDNEYGTDPNNNQATLMLEMDVAAENIRQAEEGTVLLRNENGALPLAEGAGVTIFGNGAFHSIGVSSSTPFESITASTLTSALQDALEQGAAVTDDCAAVERLGKVVFLVEGDEENLKITTPTDLVLAEAILRAREEGR